ncbi:MAG: phosphopantetheine-binding protein [Neisseria sp.]|uniref:acyl carrier protein n=1 Tax=Neisseria sp. TaxID=192066 RepID=UPI0026DA8927|nr:phosphopantetheine-binding protein [Neisseria sp.]MDO4641622.1 phosphopantetheine-binding protein [Neisseria sp.]
MAYTFTLAPDSLETELKKLILAEADKADEIDMANFGDDTVLFGDESPIGLDSLDALQVSVALQQHFQVRLQGDRMVRKHMMCVRDLAAFVRKEHAG